MLIYTDRTTPVTYYQSKASMISINLTPRRAALILLILISTLGLVSAGCANFETITPAGPPVVKAARVTAGPKVDGLDDAVWKQAPVTKVKIIQTGENVDVQALYTKDRVYVRAHYPDSTHDYIDRPWIFDGAKWKQQGQQDSLAFVWNINDSLHGFNEHGFSILTQGLEENRHPWEIYIEGGNAAKAPAWFAAQKADFWSTGLQLPYGKAEDWALRPQRLLPSGADWIIRLVNQHDQYPGEAPWVLNKTVDWSRPVWILKPGLTLEEDPYPVQADLVDIDGHTPVAGERQPFVVYRSRQARWGGSKDDVDGAEHWAGGFWTVEMGRPLNTGHDDDIQFAPGQNKTYTFGLLVRRRGSRYEPTGPIKFVFEPQK